MYLLYMYVRVCRCLVQVHHSLPSILKTILRDEFIAWQKASSDQTLATPDCDPFLHLTLSFSQHSPLYVTLFHPTLMLPFFLFSPSSHLLLFPCLWLQKQEEAQSSNLVSTADVDNEIIIKLVTDAVSSILTRLQSK